MPSGGGGMLSTAEDYLRFAQMLQNGGELDGARILAPATVQLMTSNHLAFTLMTGDALFGPRPGLGWGYDCAVFFDPLQANEFVGKGSFFWLGVADTWFWVDPTNDLSFYRNDSAQARPPLARCPGPQPTHRLSSAPPAAPLTRRAPTLVCPLGLLFSASSALFTLRTLR